MKAILEFNLPKDQPEYNDALKGVCWKNVCWEIDQYLLKEIKYNDDNSDYKIKVLEKVREKFYGFMNEYDLKYKEK